MKFSLLSTLFLTIAVVNLPAQSSLAERTDLSDLVVEGVIVSKESFWNADQTKVLTRNTLEVSKQFKGMVSPEGTVDVITQGGRVEDLVSQVSHSFQLSVGQEGIFFLNQDQQTNLLYAYRAWAVDAPLVRYVDTKETFRAVDQHGAYGRPDHDLYTLITAATHQDYQTLRKNSLERNIEKWLDESLAIRSSSDILINFSLENIELIGDQFVEFDIMAKTSHDGIRFAGTDIYLSYTTNAFGENVVANQKLQAWKETIIEDQTYTLDLSDQSSSVVRMLVNHGFQPDQLYPLSQFFEKFMHVRLDIASIYQLAQISFDDLTFNDQSIFYDPATDSYFGFDKVGVSDPVFPFMVCSISDISFEENPVGYLGYAAGINQIVRITGQNFGDQTGPNNLGQVSLPDAGSPGSFFEIGGNPDVLGRIITFWSDTEIHLNISGIGSNMGVDASGNNPVGSGLWSIQGVGSGVECSREVEVDFAGTVTLETDFTSGNQDENTDKWLSLAKSNSSPSFNVIEWYLNVDDIPSYINVTDLEAVIESALCDWETDTNVSLEYAGLTNALSTFDNQFTISFSSQLPAGVGMLTANRFNDFDFCNSYDLVFNEKQNEADIEISTALEWYVDVNDLTMGDGSIESTQTDLYAALIHELGHSLGLGHATDLASTNFADDSKVMYPQLGPGEAGFTKRDIDIGSILGVLLNVETTLENNDPGECFTQHTVPQIFDSDCDNIIITSVSDAQWSSLDVFPNPVLSSGNIYLSKEYNLTGVEFAIYSIDGTQHLSGRVTLENSIQLKELPPGMYILRLKKEDEITDLKFITID